MTNKLPGSGATWDKHGDSTRRRIVETWTLGTYRVKVTTYHDKSGKAYTSIISECEISESSPGFYFERHRLHRDVNKLAGRVSVSRYSWPNMERAHNIAADSVSDLISQLLTANSLAA